jgi:16S rRNA A1518/A1519 N6-dimethyltransferase RsmA/KsgA/DIM1 with predicted DNA glycosylase/AP lyase activity
MERDLPSAIVQTEPAYSLVDAKCRSGAIFLWEYSPVFDDLPLFNPSDSGNLATLEPRSALEIPMFNDAQYQNKTDDCSSFAPELFPTPDEVIELMLKPFIEDDPEFRQWSGPRLKRITEILDPSAGKGHLLDYIAKNYSTKRDPYHLLACEIEQDLRYVLNEKNHTVIGSDWLEFDEPRQFQFIIINPPFSEGARHLLKAWEHCDPDGNVTCLLNAETVNNPFTSERKKLQELIDLYGEVENIGQAFKRSERPTEVEVVIVRLHKPKSTTRIEFEGVQFEEENPIDAEGFNENPLAHRNVIPTLVAHYKRASEILVKRHQVQAQLNFCLTGTKEDSYSPDELFRIREDLPKQLDALKSRFWNTLFNRTKIVEVTTSGFQRDFISFQRSQTKMGFTEKNILEVLEIFFLNRAEIMQNCIVEVFDELTKYHENCLGEGWKTNSAFQVTKKLIFPYGVTFDKLWGFRQPYSNRDSVLDDLDKVLMYINGDRDICHVTTAIQREIDKNRHTGATIESSYFKIRFFKKGTIHLWFLDEKLWEEFNRRAAIGKKWIGTEESRFTKSQKRW